MGIGKGQLVGWDALSLWGGVGTLSAQVGSNVYSTEVGIATTKNRWDCTLSLLAFAVVEAGSSQ
jgi:hypothetical protein